MYISTHAHHLMATQCYPRPQASWVRAWDLLVYIEGHDEHTEGAMEVTVKK